MSQAKVLDPGSFSYSPSLSSKDKYKQKKASPWSVFCPAWPSPLRTSLNRSFAAPQESKSMGNVLALSAKGNRRVVQQHEKWHYNEEAEASFWKPICARLLRGWSERETSDETWIQPHTCLPLDKVFQRFWTSCGRCFCFHYHRGILQI